MNGALVKRALEKVPNPEVLVNLVSQRVRQLTGAGGSRSQPLVVDVDHLSAADIALHEIIEEKMGFDLPRFVALSRPTGRNRARPQGWARV